MSRPRVFVLVASAISLVAVGLVATELGEAGAAGQGPIQITLQAGSPTGASCPNGTYVAVNPGPPQSPTFVLKGPGPISCPPGVDVLINPGPPQSPQGEAVTIPLSKKSCAAATALFNEELGMLQPASDAQQRSRQSTQHSKGNPCPGGDAALASLEAAVANVPVSPSGQGFVSPPSFGAPSDGGFLLVNPGPIQVPSLSGTYESHGSSSPKGIFDVAPAAGGTSAAGVLRLKPSRSAGDSTVVLVDFAPVVTTQPVSQSGVNGSTLTFSAAAAGNPVPTVVWQVSADGGSTWSDTSVTSTTWSAPVYSIFNGWELRAVFTNSVGTAISDPATITVTS